MGALHQELAHDPIAFGYHLFNLEMQIGESFETLGYVTLNRLWSAEVE
jgi:hypothetical protein